MKLTIELTAHPDLLGAIEKLTGLFTGRVERAIAPTPKVERAVMPEPQADAKPAPPKKAPKPAPAPVEETTLPEAETEASTGPNPDTTITLEELRAEAQKIAIGGKREALKDLLTEFGADKIPNLDTAKYDAFMQRLKKL